MFGINFFTGKRENENIALAWVTKFAVKDSIFEKNFSLLGVGDSKDEDSPLLLKEGQNVFKFYASGRRFCQGLLATMELQSRHDLISRLFNMVVPCKDEITFEVFMNDDAMDQVVFALAKKKAAKTMQKEVRDLQRFASLVSPPSNRKWVVDDLAVISESKEVAGDLITEVVLEQVFGDKSFEKYGKGFISMHFSDQYVGAHKKKLVFKFALPDANHMADMTRLVALVPHYIDLIGRHKLSSQARSKTEAARQKAAQEAYKEYQNARQEALQKKKADQRKLMEEAEAKLSAEALRKKEAKERARQMKKSMPKVKMTRGCFNRNHPLQMDEERRLYKLKDWALSKQSWQRHRFAASLVGSKQVFGDKAFEKYGKGFISMHFSDQYVGAHKKKLVFKFALPDANHMADMTRLVALVPHYIDLIGRYKLSSQARSKTEAARQKAAQEAYKEYQNARQEALQK
ncbi:hypothetical protein HYC85_002744 [Camellia sinensis]|uniref:DUF1682 domain-containing protein n=1 Tax=Camellia sinensis TaxID=4442 RepID=A0A7J7I9L2_CAMSI|nr:hypothetical protein HYC85_002744 [Camellia sinensis]